MGYPEDEARGALRFSFGRSTTDAEVDAAIEVVPRIVAAARAAESAIAAERLAMAPSGANAVSSDPGPVVAR